MLRSRETALPGSDCSAALVSCYHGFRELPNRVSRTAERRGPLTSGAGWWSWPAVSPCPLQPCGKIDPDALLCHARMGVKSSKQKRGNEELFPQAVAQSRPNGSEAAMLTSLGWNPSTRLQSPSTRSLSAARTAR